MCPGQTANLELDSTKNSLLEALTGIYIPASSPSLAHYEASRAISSTLHHVLSSATTTGPFPTKETQVMKNKTRISEDEHIICLPWLSE